MAELSRLEIGEGRLAFWFFVEGRGVSRYQEPETSSSSKKIRSSPKSAFKNLCSHLLHSPPTKKGLGFVL
ncbi:hypothetical protein L3X38_013771 [Prunus dulcis]|uniref:Uncharacterized protein n=1 Tax=Prunus dulcis TaxID=3755 RepID=A0AAD4ZHC3_PRUDU|nr:hypothetical protein L3X38_013771 [Prunus dulcis]